MDTESTCHPRTEVASAPRASPEPLEQGLAVRPRAADAACVSEHDEAQPPRAAFRLLARLDLVIALSVTMCGCGHRGDSAPPLVPADPSAALAEALTRASVRSLERTSRVAIVEARGGTTTARRLVITAATDALGSWLCEDDRSTRRCWSLPFSADVITRPALDEAHAAQESLRSRAFFGDEATGRILFATVDFGGAARGEWRRVENGFVVEAPPEGVDPAVVALGARRPPALLDALDAVGDVVSAPSGDALVARLHDRLAACRLTASGSSCATTAPVAAFAGEPPGSENGLERVVVERADLWRVEYSRTAREDAPYEWRTYQIFLRPRPASVVASIITEHTRATPDAQERTTFVTDVEVRSSDCLLIDSAQGERTWGDAVSPSREATVEHVLLAPDRIAVGGLDELGVDLSGAWTILPAGGLARATECP